MQASRRDVENATKYKTKFDFFYFFLFFCLWKCVLWIFFSRHVFDCGVAVKVMVVEHSICLGPMEPNAELAIGVNMVNVCQEIEWL